MKLKEAEGAARCEPLGKPAPSLHIPRAQPEKEGGGNFYSLDLKLYTANVFNPGKGLSKDRLKLFFFLGESQHTRHKHTEILEFLCSSNEYRPYSIQ